VRAGIDLHVSPPRVRASYTTTHRKPREFPRANFVLHHMSLQLTTCPECGAPAEVVDRFVLPSTHGPVEHVKTRCVTGPWFVTPARAKR
jgi:hypothetical protein